MTVRKEKFAGTKFRIVKIYEKDARKEAQLLKVKIEDGRFSISDCKT